MFLRRMRGRLTAGRKNNLTANVRISEERGRVVRLLPADVHRISLPTPFQVGDVNTWLLRGEPLTLVDTGPLMDESAARLDRELGALGLAVEDLELIVLTHQHTENSGLAGELVRRSGAELAGTAALARFLADVEASADADDDYSVALMRIHGVTQGTMDTLRGISRAYRRYAASATVGRVLAGECELVAGGRRWTVSERPGHSPTDTVLASAGVLLAGDHLLEKISSNPILHVPIGTADPAALAAAPERPRTLPTYVASLRATAAADAGELVLPGHGDPFRGAAELVERRLEQHERRAEKILAALDRPRTAADIGRDLWRHVPVTQAFLVLSEVLGHLDLLEQRGAVAAATTDGRVIYERTG
jgi:glyoxylase-like metal-dependent hydrolase (beta-lactamase superfamily II)